jgi:hypothetical protein
LAALILLVIVLAIVGMLYIGYTQHTPFFCPPCMHNI